MHNNYLSYATAVGSIVDSEEYEKKSKSPWRSITPAILTTFLLCGLAYFAAKPLLKNIDPIIYQLASVVSFSKPEYVIYASDTTTAYFQASGTKYEQLIQPWKQYFAAKKIKVEVITDLKQLVNRAQQTTLILPSAVALTESERIKILAHHSQGGSILVTWSTGSWYGSGKWAGWDFLKSLGAEVQSDTTTKLTGHLVTRGETPVTFSVEAGQRISLSPDDTAVLYKDAQSTAARLMNWSRIIEPTIGNTNGVILFKEKSPKTGRVVAFGFSENAWRNTADAVYPILDDTFNWLMRRPAVVLAAWPNKNRAAQVIEMDTEEGFHHAEGFSRILKEKNIPATFFVLTSVAKKFPDTLMMLHEDHEIGFHGDVHEGFKDQPASVQRGRIQAMKADIAEVLGSVNPVGFRPPHEDYDTTTEKILTENGIQYLVVDPAYGEGRLPKFAKLGAGNSSKSLVVLARTQRDDLNLTQEFNTSLLIKKALIDDLIVLTETGGLGLLSVHSQNLAPNSPLTEALPDYLNYLNTLRNKVWITTTNAVADWWLERSRVSLSTIIRGDVVEVNLSVIGAKPVEGLNLIVMTPARGSSPIVSKLKVGLPTPTIVELDSLRYGLIFSSLSPGNYSYQISFQ